MPFFGTVRPPNADHPLCVTLDQLITTAFEILRDLPPGVELRRMETLVMHLSNARRDVAFGFWPDAVRDLDAARNTIVVKRKRNAVRLAIENLQQRLFELRPRIVAEVGRPM